jgi:hypothetical protein
MYDIYSNARADAWRFTLGRSGAKPLLVVGLNPSTATQERADTTVAKVEQVAARSGYDGFVMLNLYPVRATAYRTLPCNPDSEAFETNLQKMVEVVSSQAAPAVWAAWGASVTHFDYFLRARDELIRRLSPHNVSWLRLGELTNGGHPRHPSRLNYSWTLQPYHPRGPTPPGEA